MYFIKNFDQQLYREDTELFVDGESIFLREGKTQGDPLTMMMYAIATVPLINKLHSLAKQVWFADDVTCLRGFKSASNLVGSGT